MFNKINTNKHSPSENSYIESKFLMVIYFISKLYFVMQIVLALKVGFTPMETTISLQYGGICMILKKLRFDGMHLITLPFVIFI